MINNSVAKHKYIKEILNGVFSLSFFKALIFSFGYFIHESVTWRYKLRSGKNVRIHATASIRNPENVFIDDYSHINHQCCIWAGEYSKISIGKKVLMGPGVKFFSTNHGLDLGAPMMDQGYKEADIYIEDDCWLGANVVVLRGVRIAKGSVIAAGAVVTKSLLEEYCIYGGIPAKKISERN